MAKERFITGLDIGTSSIKTLTVKREPKEEGLGLVLKSSEISDGVRKGTVVGVEKVSSICKNILSKTSEDLGQNIDSIYINLSGSHLFSIPSRGLISVSRADQKISEEDIQRVLQAAKTINLSSNKEIFEVFSKEYIIDGVRGIREPIGLQGVRLEVEVLALGGFSPYLQNARQAVLNSGLEILDMIPSPIAAARAVLTGKQKELGVALLDIGAGITSLAVFEEGSLIHLAILPMGSADITNDIAIGLKVDIDTAERVKIEYGSCFLKGRDIKRKINTGEDDPLIFSQKFLVKIISDRISEIFEQANEELKSISKERLLPAGIVLTGGGAKMHKIVELAKNKIHLPVRLGKPEGILGINGDLSMATVCGLVLMGADLEGVKGGSDVVEKVISKVKKIFKNFIP
jgi:cell division protein FtsA